MEEELNDWRSWDQKWQRIITGQSGFEWNFAKEVIQKVPGLGPNNVTPQQSFIGNDGRQRRMDFAIDVDDVKIAIEVEGWDKTGEKRGKNKEEHDEFNRRIQSLESQGWRVLTVTNAQFMADPAHYANLIRQLILQGPKAPENHPPIVNDAIEEPENLAEDMEEKPPQPVQSSMKSIYALIAIVVIAAAGVIIWALNGGDEVVILFDDLEPRSGGGELESEVPEDESEKRDQSSAQPTTQPSQPSQPLPSSSEVPDGTYITKNRVDIRTYEDSQGDVDCGYLPAAAKPVWLPDPDKDPYNLDGWISDRGDSWACGKPIYITTDGDWGFEKWEDENGDVDCGDIPESKKPIYLFDAENDPYNLDGRGNNVGDKVACYPTDS